MDAVASIAEERGGAEARQKCAEERQKCVEAGASACCGRRLRPRQAATRRPRASGEARRH